MVYKEECGFDWELCIRNYVEGKGAVYYKVTIGPFLCGIEEK